MKAGEQYANFTLDFKNTYLFFYAATTVTITADIIHFTQEKEYDPFPNKYLTTAIPPSYDTELYRAGSTVLNKKGETFLIRSVVDAGHLFLQSTENEMILLENVAMKNYYSNQGEKKGYVVGSVYPVPPASVFVSKEMRILGLGMDHMLVELTNGDLEEVKYP